MYQKDSDNPGYNIPLAYHIKGRIDIDLFKKSLTLLFARQHTMFSVFKKKDGIPYIDIVPHDVVLTLVDFSDEPADTRRQKIFSFAGEDTRRCFNIESGPLYRLYLLKEDNENYFFHATIHHLIFDGWSRRLFVEELSRNYLNLLHGKEERLEELEFHSYDYAGKEEQASEATDDAALKEFWKNNLKGSSTELRFPYDYARKDHSSGLGRREAFSVSKENTLKLKELCRRENATVFNGAISVLGVLLQKYTGENDICIGMPVSNRRAAPELEKIFGMFVNTSVVRLKIDGKKKFNEHINYTKRVVKDAIKHSGIPFEKIVEAVKPKRIEGINPIFQVSLSWLNNFTIPIDLGQAVGERICLPEGVSHFDMSFFMWDGGETINGEIEYSTDILKHETVVRLKNNLLTLIDNLVNTPEASMDSIPMISAEERSMIDRVNDTKTGYPKDKTVVQLFEEQALLFPDKPAVIYRDKSVTYRELNEAANQLAGTLRGMGVKRDTPVGVYVEKSLEMVTGVLAILKAGGAYLPIDPDYPHQRVEFILKESGCKVILTQSKFINANLGEVKMVDLNSSSSYKPEKGNISPVNTPSDLAYYMYTSGTTGVPKGSMIPHYSVVRLVRDINYMEMSSSDRLLYTSAIVFDVTTYEIWAPLLNGMTLYVADKETILDANALGEELFRNEITILHLTSALFTQLAESRTDIFSRLRYLLVGGDVLSAHHINKVRKDNPDLKVINCYGPSENTTYSTTYLIDKTHEINIPIGKPVSNSTVYIFDRNMNYQPVGVMGEIYVGGDGLSRGYLNRDDLNSTKFVPHPFIPGERLYRSGDFGKWLPDCNIEFHGRVDNQIKIRGFRVELEEIESVISEIAGVVESVVKPVKVEEGDYRLVAFLHVHSSFNSDAGEVSRQLKEKLPSYMIPSAFKFLSEFPKTINGKTDKKALKFAVADFETEKREEVGILTETEAVIHKIWCEALKSNDVLRTDNFFDIGGTSLLAISVFSKITSNFNMEIPLRVFFDSPKIEDLARAIEIRKIRETSVPVKEKGEEKSNIINGEL